ncbi:D-alanyl-D-alanine carboxypeptidase, partial [Streptomyces sp. NPDC039028]
MPEPRMWQLTAGSAALGLALAAVAVAAAGPWDSGQRTAERARAAAPGRVRDVRHPLRQGERRGPGPVRLAAVVQI